MAALGRVTFELITQDRSYHLSQISPTFEFLRFESTDATAGLRRSTGIRRGIGTLVTLEVISTRRGLAVLKSFIGAIRISVGEIDIGVDIEPELGIADSGDLEVDLPDLFSAVAEAADTVTR